MLKTVKHKIDSSEVWSSTDKHIRPHSCNLNSEGNWIIDDLCFCDEDAVKEFVDIWVKGAFMNSEEYQTAVGVMEDGIKKKLEKLMNLLNCFISKHATNEWCAVFGGYTMNYSTVLEDLKAERVSTKKITNSLFAVKKFMGIDIELMKKYIDNTDSLESIVDIEPTILFKHIHSVVVKIVNFCKELHNVKFHPSCLDVLFTSVLKMIDSPSPINVPKFSLFFTFLKDFVRMFHQNRVRIYKMFMSGKYKNIISLSVYLFINVVESYKKKDKSGKNYVWLKIRQQLTLIHDFVIDNINTLKSQGKCNIPKEYEGMIDYAIEMLTKFKEYGNHTFDFNSPNVEIYSVECPVYNCPLSKIIGDEPDTIEQVIRQKMNFPKDEKTVNDIDKELFTILFRRKKRAGNNFTGDEDMTLDSDLEYFSD